METIIPIYFIHSLPLYIGVVLLFFFSVNCYGCVPLLYFCPMTLFKDFGAKTQNRPQEYDTCALKDRRVNLSCRWKTETGYQKTECHCKGNKKCCKIMPLNGCHIFDIVVHSLGPPSRYPDSYLGRPLLL